MDITRLAELERKVSDLANALKEQQSKSAHLFDVVMMLQSRVGVVEGRTEGLNCPASPLHRVCPLGRQDASVV
jgi:hypothetical protein